MTLDEWAHQIIEGPSGMNIFESREMVGWHASERVCAAMWAIRCLSNPRCEGSDIVLEEVIQRRKELGDE